MRSKLQEPGAEATVVFDFRGAEMRQTRLRVDELLAAGKINEAEQYMEMRRQFWEYGYHIRKINQAYFVFYGSYNDEPGGGAAGARRQRDRQYGSFGLKAEHLKEFIEKGAHCALLC